MMGDKTRGWNMEEDKTRGWNMEGEIRLENEIWRGGGGDKTGV